MRTASHITSLLVGLMLVGAGVSVSRAQAPVLPPAEEALSSHHDALLGALMSCLDVPVEAWSEAYESGRPEIALDWGGALPFMEASVSAELLAVGLQLSQGAAGGQLRIDVDEGSLVYERAPRRAAEPLERRIRVGLRYTLTQPGGGVLASDSCLETRSDLHTRRGAASLADPRWSVTNPDIPQTGFWRRYLQPTVLVAAAAVGTYLFFNLRSDRADGG